MTDSTRLSLSQKCFEYVPTDYGSMFVEFDAELLANDSGSSKHRKPILVTVHDIGYNHQTNFESIFDDPQMRSMLKHFIVLHLNAPGQEPAAPRRIWNDYPTFDEIPAAMHQVLQQFSIEHFLGFGVGAGANLLIRYQIRHPTTIDGLFLVNPCWDSNNLLDSIKAKLFLYASKYRLKFLMRGMFKVVHQNDPRTKPIKTKPNQSNLLLFIDSFQNRSRFIIKTNQLRCPIVIVAGQLSSNFDDCRKLAKFLNPANYELVTIGKVKHVWKEKPEVLARIFQLFVKGLGYLKNYPLLADIQGGDDNDSTMSTSTMSTLFYSNEYDNGNGDGGGSSSEPGDDDEEDEDVRANDVPGA